MRIAAAPLVGRLAELALIDSALAELDRRQWAAIALFGEPGIGKTRLLTELTGRADRLGHLVLSGSASELERDLPFWVFVSALDDYVRGRDPRLFHLLSDQVQDELATVLPSMTSPRKDGGSAPLHARYRTHHAVRELLQSLTATK